ncbi:MULTISPECIES: hypothetical protein [unclassified Sinorhizobium]|uniref:hypothetical protein n=1 Tax=unclassified Sinorhizobium TaxID=2613772 RepID=UPI0024C2570D|nr:MULTISPECIES: hypothetical protein [unclassified Sinorhizobium]MDK1373360.1 hypothetical protein [Sinorhizobium sp. 6-70]MDK1481169.1 hypothetical protein [Sinorhizobium sp. 6-117]
MYPFLIKQGLKRVGRKLGKSMFNDTLNPDEAYADRIARDFGINWHDAYDAYRQNPRFWEESYKEDPVGSPSGPAMARSERTSRLPAATVSPDGVSSPEKSGIWDKLFPGRVSLRRAQDDWRE